MKAMNTAEPKIRASLRFGEETIPVGTLSLIPDRKRGNTAFQYDPSFLDRKLDISPLHLPLRPEPTLCDLNATQFGGLPGVFADSLPDRWGDDMLKEAISPLDGGISMPSGLDRLRLVGDDGPGALVYEPTGDDKPGGEKPTNTAMLLNAEDIDRLTRRAQDIKEEGGPGFYANMVMNDKGEMVGFSYTNHPPGEAMPTFRTAMPDPRSIAPPETASPLNADDIDRLAEMAEGIEKRAEYGRDADGKRPDHARELLRMARSVGGAMPKILIGMNDKGEMIDHARRLPPGYRPWILKLQIRGERIETDFCAIEQAYAIMARRSGLAMPPTRLIPSKNGPGHFAVQRFDRTADGRRLHMHTASGLMHRTMGWAHMDYKDLIDISRRLSGDDRDLEEIYRLAVFNVLACSRDDHGKNFSFLMDGEGAWALAPAYDLTFRRGLFDSQSTTVMGERGIPSNQALLRLAEAADIPAAQAKEIMDRTRSAVADFESIAKECGVSDRSIWTIAGHMKESDKAEPDA